MTCHWLVIGDSNSTSYYNGTNTWLIGTWHCCQKPWSAHFPGDAGGTTLATNGTFAHMYCHQNGLFYLNIYDFTISGCYLQKYESEWHQINLIHKLRSRIHWPNLLWNRSCIADSCQHSSMSIFLVSTNNQCKLDFDWMIKQKQCRFLRCQQIGMYEIWGYVAVCGSNVFVAMWRCLPNTHCLKCLLKLLIHSQTSTVQPLKFGKG